MNMNRTIPRLFLLATLLIPAFLITVGPVLYMVLSSLKPEMVLLSLSPTLLPRPWSFNNYHQLFKITPLIVGLKNSLITACLVTVITAVCSSYTAYLLTRMKLRGLEFISKLLLFCYALPDVILGIGFYIVFSHAGLLNNYLTLALGQSAVTVPFGIWMLWAYFRQIPIELDEAAAIDGADRLQIIWHVIFPVAMPGIGAVAVYSFIISWNEYTLANMLSTADALKTLPVTMGQLVKSEGAFWGLGLAMATVSLVPAAVFVFFLLKPLMAGLTAGALKG